MPINRELLFLEHLILVLVCLRAPFREFSFQKIQPILFKMRQDDTLIFFHSVATFTDLTGRVNRASFEWNLTCITCVRARLMPFVIGKGLGFQANNQGARLQCDSPV